jgi:hypothetical protein
VSKGEIRTNGEDDIGSCRIVVLPKSERFSDNSFEAISLHCTMNLSMHTDSQPAGIRRIRLADQGKTFTMHSPPLAVNFLKLPTFADQGAFQKSVPGQS